MESNNIVDKFKGLDITYYELTKWILEKYKKYKVTEIRYFGSRIYGNPCKDSDIDVYILFSGKAPDRGPIFTELYNRLQVEFHAFIDFHDGYIPSWLIGNSTQNAINLK